jgi:hypothetical protein
MLSTDLSKRHSSFALCKHFTITLFLLRPQATPSSHLVPRSGRKAATLLRVAPSRFFRRAWHGEAPASRLPVLLRSASGRRRARLPSAVAPRQRTRRSPRHLAHPLHRRQRHPAGDGPRALSCPRVVGDAGEQQARSMAAANSSRCSSPSFIPAMFVVDRTNGQWLPEGLRQPRTSGALSR